VIYGGEREECKKRKGDLDDGAILPTRSQVEAAGLLGVSLDNRGWKMKRQGATRTDQPVKSPLAVPRNQVLDHAHSFGPNVCVQRQANDMEVEPHAPSLVNGVLSSPGRPLDTETRSFMEPHFGYDFSGVRIHTDQAAADSAGALGANAYTARNHIAFAPGQYAPETETGNRLIAHELTHVVQQGPTSAGAQRGHELEITEPSDVSERVADQISDGKLDARNAAPVGPSGANAGGVQLIQRDKAKNKKESPAPAPAVSAERQIPANEAWLFAENRLITELETRYEELVRLGAYKTKSQIADCFAPYDNDLNADSKFNTFIGIAGGTAGNVPNDPSSIQPLQPGSPASTPHGPIPQTFSVSGGIAGGLAAAISPLVGLILDTSKVSEVKDNLNTKVEQFLVQDLTTSSPTYTAFETQARSEMQQYFLSSWSSNDRRHDAAGLSDLVNETAIHARASYGASSTLGLQVLAAVSDYVGKQLTSVLPVLDELEKKHRKKRLGAFALGAGVVGGLLGGALGFGLGGGVGLAIGAGVGLIGGGLIGLAAGGIMNAVTPTAADTRKKSELEKAQEEQKRQDSLKKNDILDPRYRPSPRSEFA
jgi:hypothetical protein